jgi:hypothetical protein
MNESNSSVLSLSILGFETGPKKIKLDFENHKGEFALRIHPQAGNHARGFVMCPKLLESLQVYDVTVAGIATTPEGQDYLVVVDSTKAVLADKGQLAPWGFDSYIAATKEILNPEIITI